MIDSTVSSDVRIKCEMRAFMESRCRINWGWFKVWGGL